MLENAKSWYDGNNESKITFTVHCFHILTNVTSVEFTLNTIDNRWENSTTVWDIKGIDDKSLEI